MLCLSAFAVPGWARRRHGYVQRGIPRSWRKLRGSQGQLRADLVVCAPKSRLPEWRRDCYTKSIGATPLGDQEFKDPVNAVSYSMPMASEARPRNDGRELAHAGKRAPFLWLGATRWGRVLTLDE